MKVGTFDDNLDMILISVQVCAEVKVLPNWVVLSVNGESLICKIF